MTKRKKQIQEALATLNKVVWRNKEEGDFQDAIRSICTICVACKLNVDDVLKHVDVMKVEPKVVKTTKPRAKTESAK